MLAYANSLIAQIIYVQNFVFWFEGDYFEGALTKPLLHTWSLAVEEQFYLIWAAAILMCRRSMRFILTILILITILSFVTGLMLETRSPKTVFYMLPTRIWQFAVGILAYLATRWHPTIPDRIAPVALFGVAAIIAAAILFDEQDPFPGEQALIACFACGISLFVLDATNARLSLLLMRPVRYIGEISYGFYLWHWPPLSLYYLQTGTQASPIIATLLMLLAFAGASASYHLVEQPIRRGLWLSTSRNIISMTATGSSLIGAAAALALMTSGLLFMYPLQLQPYLDAPQQKGGFRCGKTFVALNPGAELCPLYQKTGEVGLLVLGDSHADVLDELITKMAREKEVAAFLTTRNCDLGRFGTLDFCSDDVFETVIEQAIEAGVTDVFAISNWERDKTSTGSMQKDTDLLLAAGLNVYIMEIVPQDPSYDPRIRARQALSSGRLERTGIPRTTHEINVGWQREIFERVAKSRPDRVRLLRPAEYLCDINMCRYEADGVPFYFDSNHLTFRGGIELRPMLEKAFDNISIRAK
jgi:hypothetical protein